ncbi:Pentatricopeptide repeat-containing protein, mitochondrial [Glycine soja]|uniref:Pentatricopeptide repeat-containing protein, mitochondrial n=1 Tax=Glycine soja TaxID=3848 RepID=A0A0B2R7E5_GLYSO|nr:Pentatricopeptide repeat-containing protein, mitochondrial [Glycine soja]
MWALRRASDPRVKLAGTNSVDEESVVIYESNGITYGGFLSPNMRYHSGHNASLNFTVGKRTLSSSRTKEEDDLEDGFSELETPASDGNECDDLLTSDYADLLSDDVEEPHKEKERPRRGRVESKLFHEIMNAQCTSLHLVLEKWLEEGNELTREEA